MARLPRRNVFISYHYTDEDRFYKQQFLWKARTVAIDKSVDTGDIDDTNLKVTRVREIIRDDYSRASETQQSP